MDLVFEFGDIVAATSMMTTSEMLSSVVWENLTDVSEMLTASISL
jgi:hypothetical protein